jgi:hypothetical protein
MFRKMKFCTAYELVGSTYKNDNDDNSTLKRLANERKRLCYAGKMLKANTRNILKRRLMVQDIFENYI